MPNIAKILIALLLPSGILAETCAPNDTQCKQLEIINSTGIKPTQIQQSVESAQPSKNTAEATETRQFEIPSATFAKPKTEPEPKSRPNLTKPDQSNATDTKPKAIVPSINIFAPNANTTTNESTQITNQTEQKPYDIPPPSSTGMQYR